MNRSVIQIASSTLVVSLPTGWLRKHGISKGDLLRVDEVRESLIMTPTNEQKTDKISIDIRGLSNAVKRVLGALYKAGYDEIEINYENQKERQAVLDALKVSLHSLGIVNETSSQIIVKNLSEFRHEEFNVVLRRLFLLLLESCKEYKTGTNMDQIILRDAEINDCADQCRRSIIRKGYVQASVPPALYYIVEELEKIGDIIRDLAKEGKVKTGKIIAWTTLFREFYDLYYDFDIKRFDAWLRKTDSIKQEKNEAHISALAESLFDMNGALLMVKLTS